MGGRSGRIPNKNFVAEAAIEAAVLFLTNLVPVVPGASMELAVRCHLVKGVMQTTLGVVEDARLTGAGENDAGQLRSVRCLVEAITRVIPTPDADMAPVAELLSADHWNLDALVWGAMGVATE